MTEKSNNPDPSVDELTARMLDVGLSDEEHKALLAHLHDPDARDRFLEHVLLHSTMRQVLGGCRLTPLYESLFGTLNAEQSPPPPPVAAPPPPAPVDTWHIDWRGTSLALLLLTASLWGAYSYFVRRGALQPDPVGPPHVATAQPQEAATDYVARIVRVSPDIVWADAADQFDFLLRLHRDEPVRITSGSVQIDFFSGAKIVLHGPAVFVPTGPASARLDSGRLRGDVDDGNFRLTTRAAEVIDLGTTFGVSADAATGTDVMVFKGEVRVISQPGSDRASETINMSEGMAARVHLDGTTDYEFQPNESDYSRDVHASHEEQRNTELSLVDVLSGGNGLDSCIAGAVDPTTGRMDQGKWRMRVGAGNRPGDGRFHGVEWHPLIDGVFVPAKHGRHTQLDSLGHVVDLPTNAGRTWGPIWGRRWESGVSSADGAPDFWGDGTLRRIIARLKTARHGVVGMHASVGITLDLQAIRLQQHCSPISFQAVVTNLDNSDEEEPELNKGHKADFRVYVDGVLKFCRLGFTRDDGDAPIVVPLSAQDSRLTLLSTDAEGSNWFDHIVLIDPLVLLER